MTHTPANPAYIANLVREAHSAGIAVYVEQQTGKLLAPGGASRPDILEKLKLYRAELLAYFLGRDEDRLEFALAFHTKLELAYDGVRLPQHVDWAFWELVADALGAYTAWGIEGNGAKQQKEYEGFKSSIPGRTEELRIRALSEWQKASAAREAYMRVKCLKGGLTEEERAAAWSKLSDLSAVCWQWGWRLWVIEVLNNGGDLWLKGSNLKPWLDYLGRNTAKWENE